MKTRIFFFSLFLALLLGGCVVKSLHPFYTEADVTFDPELLGDWIEDDSTRWVITPYSFSTGFMKEDSIDNSYLVELHEEGREPQHFNAHLFRLGGRMYLDFLPLRDERHDDFLNLHLVATHSLALVEKDSNGRLVIGWFNNEWLDRLFSENRVRISHEIVRDGTGKGANEFILTASTAELQKFVVKYGTTGDKALCEDEDNFLCIRLNRNGHAE